MGYSLTYITGIAFCMVSVLARSFGELIVLRHPSGDDNYEMDLTCLADDDDAALIWNYNPGIEELEKGKNTSSDFEPKKLPAINNPKCAIWNSKTCLVEWDKKDGWKMVNSGTRPMAPVLDFRWEGFKELVFTQSGDIESYQYAGKVKELSGTAVFSVRGLRNLNVFLCKNEDPTKGECFWIDLKASTISLCAKGAPVSLDSSSSGYCTEITEVTHPDENLVDPYIWRTFRLEWNSDQRTIKVFKDHDDKPFVIGTDSTWRNLPHISVRSDRRSRFRFHFYNYFLTDREDTEGFTKNFYLSDKIFCVKLLVGLCRECELNIKLFKKGKEGIAHKMWNISGDQSSVHNGLLTWRSVKLDVQNINSKSVKLVIRTVLNNKEIKGQWAIDHFRICELDGGIRESNISIARKESGDYQPGWSLVRCQKLSYAESITVDGLSTEPYRDTSQLQQFLRRRKGACGSTCASFGKNWTICDQTGCTCDRGFQGTGCNSQCTDGNYGYNCKKKCGLCAKKTPCDKMTGYCDDAKCENFGYLPPICKIDYHTKKPDVVDIGDSTAKVLLKLEPEADVETSVEFHMKEVSSKKNSYRTLTTTRTLSTYEAYIKDLQPDTGYNITAVVKITSGDLTQRASTSETIFITSCVGKPRFRISPGVNTLEVVESPRENGCEDRDTAEYVIKIDHQAVMPKIPKCTYSILPFRYACSNLIPYTEYNVRVFLSDSLIFSTNVRTLESAPGKPGNLKSANQDHGIVELKWTHPSERQTNIKKFRIDVKYISTKLQVFPDIKFPIEIDYPVTEMKEEYSTELHLWTSTTYAVSVMAVSRHKSTSEKSVTEISVGGGVAFASGEELQVTQSGISIELETPRVVNATKNTRVSIIVKEPATYPPNIAEWIAAEYVEDERKPVNLMINCDEKKDIASNCSLRLGGTYTIVATVKDFYSDSTANITSIPITLFDGKSNLTWLIIFPLIAICLLLFVLHRNRRKILRRINGDDILPLSATMTSNGSSLAPHILQFSRTLPDAIENRVSILHLAPEGIPYNPHSCSVKVEEFEEYTREAMASGLLNSQFELLSNGPTKKCKHGKLPGNLLKNRYKNLIPYDDSRVILKKFPGDPHSDYINASYIRGYSKERAYIATQGPKPKTINDFWRMIWQEKVRVICMLTNITEDGKRKCEQYWPEVEAGIKYGNILVFNTDHQVFADYTIRTFNLGYQNKNRKVTQLHYTGWPDHGVPMYSQSLVAYLKKLLATPIGEGPVVVHCSAGIGRTGTIILCDISLRQAIGEMMFDIPAVTARMREDRSDMVSTTQQYLLAHLAITECMVYEQTQIPCSHGLPKKIEELRKQLPSDLQRLKDTVWQDRALHSLAVTRFSDMENMTTNTNRLSEFVPVTPTVAEFHRDSAFDSESNYINAVSVDGVKMKKQYLESQLPSQSTLSEYWRLIAEKKIELILILQRPNPDNPSCCDVMSGKSTLVPVPHIQVETKTCVDEEEHFTIQRLLITDTSERIPRQQPVTVLTCTEWGHGKDGKLPTAAALVSLWLASEKISRKEAPTLVLCHDGVTGCGLYLALSFLLERMAVERECDVISAVRAVRRSRTEFVQSLEQFDYLYDAAVNYFECFQTYANFT